MPSKGDVKKLEKVSDILHLSKETVKAKRAELRGKCKKLQHGKLILQIMCDKLLPLEGASCDVKKLHMTPKKAQKLGLQQITTHYNELVAVCSMQNDAFQHVFQLQKFIIQFAARYEEESRDRKNELTKIQKDVQAALKATARAKPKPKPSKQAMADYLRPREDSDGDCSDNDDDEDADDTALRLFCQ